MERVIAIAFLWIDQVEALNCISFIFQISGVLTVKQAGTVMYNIAAVCL
jgi:hypothetical protein